MIYFTSSAASETYKEEREQGEEEVASNASLQEHMSAAQRVLADAIKRQQMGLEGLEAGRFQLLKLFGRIERLHEQIDRAFGGQPFLPNVPPDSPANQRRFNAFFENHRKATRWLMKALELWMLTCGLKREDNWVPLLIAEMQLSWAKSQTDERQGIADDWLSRVLDPNQPG